MADFLPISGTELIHAEEDDTGVSAIVTATAVLPDVINEITWACAPELPSQAVITTDVTGGSATLTLSIPHFIGLIPVIAIDFLLDGDLQTVTDWHDVPDEATEIISYRKTISDGFTYTLTVTVEEEIAGESSANYLIIVDPNYTAGRDALIAAVEARS